PDRIGTVAMRNTYDLAHAVELLRNQEGATADRQQGHLCRLGLHVIETLLDHATHVIEHAVAGISIEMRNLRGVADFQRPNCDSDIAGRELGPAESKRIRGQAIADRDRADTQRIEGDMAPAAETD